MQYEGVARGAPGGARGAAASSTSRTWARSRRPARRRSSCCSACSPTTSRQIARRGSTAGGPVQRALPRGRRRARRPVHLPPRRRALPDGHERRQPRARPRLVPRARRATSPTRRSRDRIDDYAMLAVQGPRARGIVQAIADAPLPARMTAAARRLAGGEVLVCGTGYTGEDGVELLCAPEDAAGAVGRARAPRRRPGGPGRARHAAPGGLLSPLRQRPDRRARADRSRPRLVLQGGDRLHRRATPCAPCARPGPREKLVAFAIDGPGIARQGNPVVGGGEVTSGTLSPSLERRHRHGLRARRARRARHARSRSTFVARCAAPSSSRSRSTERAREWPQASYPDDLLYHPEHDWARIDGADPRLATLGITWYAQDALGEVVFFDLPAVGAASARTPPTPRSSPSRRSPT